MLNLDSNVITTVCRSVSKCSKTCQTIAGECLTESVLCNYQNKASRRKCSMHNVFLVLPTIELFSNLFPIIEYSVLNEWSPLTSPSLTIIHPTMIHFNAVPGAHDAAASFRSSSSRLRHLFCWKIVKKLPSELRSNRLHSSEPV